VASGAGIERFDPVHRSYTHVSDIRVDDLAVAPDGTLWGSRWPQRGELLTFDERGRAQVQVKLDAELDSIAFGRSGSRLENLLFVGSRASSEGNGRASLYMIDTVTLRVVELARGGPGAEQLLTTGDGRLLVANGSQVDVIAPLVAPAVVRTNPVPDSIVALPLGRITVTFSQDMKAVIGAADSASNP